MINIITDKRETLYPRRRHGDRAKNNESMKSGYMARLCCCLISAATAGGRYKTPPTLKSGGMKFYARGGHVCDTSGMK